MHRIQDIRRRRAARDASRRPRNYQHGTTPPQPARTVHRRHAPRDARSMFGPLGEYAKMVRKHRSAALTTLICAGVLVLVFAVVAQSSGAAEQPLPIDPNNAGPDTVLAETLDIEVSTPVRPADLTGLGYHPEGERLLELNPRGENLSANPLVGLLGTGDTPEDIRYYVMDRAEREGPRTGALDVGAEAGAGVYAPVSGVVTAIRPDPTMQDANIVEIKPADRPDVRVYVSLVRGPSGDVGPDSPVTAGMTMLGTVADSAAVLDPQLSAYMKDPGNHVTIFALQVG